MTIKEFILGRSYLPKDGTHTMEEHTMAMVMESHGTFVDVKVTESPVEDIVVYSSDLEILVEDYSDKIIVTDETEDVKIEMNEIKIEVE